MIGEAAARCARHPDAAVTFTCPRCGTFGCIACERRASFEAPPMCPACWALEAQRTAAVPTGGLQTAGLIIGLLAIIPCCPLAIASLLVNAIALVKATRENRWKPIVGLVVTLLGVVGQVLIFGMGARSRG